MDPNNYRTAYQFGAPRQLPPTSSQRSNVLSSAGATAHNSRLVDYHSATDISANHQNNQDFKNIELSSQTLVINSLDRNIGKESLFKFHITFNPSITTKEKTPIYDAGRNITGYEYKTRVGSDQGCHFESVLKDITKLHIKQLVMPRYNFLKCNIPSVVNVNLQEFTGKLLISNEARNHVEMMIEGGQENSDCDVVVSTYYPVQNNDSLIFDTPTNISHIGLEINFPMYFREQTDYSTISMLVPNTSENFITVICNSLEFLNSISTNDIVAFRNISALANNKFVVESVETSQKVIKLKDPSLGTVPDMIEILSDSYIINVSLQYLLIIEVEEMKKKWSYTDR